MQFSLFYRGPLRSGYGGGEKVFHKHDIRKVFHRQLKDLWQQKPLAGYEPWLQPLSETNGWSHLREKGSFVFAPLVTISNTAVAELDVHLLWPHPVGALIHNGGDLDNRLKTLFDALQMPSAPGDLKPGMVPEPDENPLFCLLENDILITKLSVQVDRLLNPSDNDEVCLFIRVTTRNLTDHYAVLPP